MWVWVPAVFVTSLPRLVRRVLVSFSLMKLMLSPESVVVYDFLFRVEELGQIWRE